MDHKKSGSVQIENGKYTYFEVMSNNDEINNHITFFSQFVIRM